jgi:DNA-binding transcriptional LysR family regulator
MTITQLNCFLSLATTKKLTKTANLFGVQVSTLSKFLSHMEDEFGGKLFRKTPYGLELTKEGEIIYPGLQFIAKKYDDMFFHMNKFTTKYSTELNVAVVYHQSQLLSRLLDFSDACPDVALKIVENPATNIENMLDNLTIDAAIIYEELLTKKYPHTFPLREDRLVAVVGREHELAGRESISVSELKNDTFFMFKGDSTMYRFQIYTCVSAGVVPLEAHHNMRIPTIMEHVAANRGVTLLAETAVNKFNNGNVVPLPITENPSLTISLILPALYQSDVCKSLVDHITGN